MNTEFEFRKFSRAEYEEYDSWFENKDIQKSLGYIDEEWFEYINNNKKGIELAVFQDNILIAVIGLAYPNAEDSSYFITNMAVKPTLQNRGLGSQILKTLIDKTDLKPNEFWAVNVFKFNIKAQRFFEKNTWKKMGEIEEDMIQYEYHKK